MPKWKILVVDDDAQLLTIITEFLANDSYIVETATDGDSAWLRLSQPEVNYDFIILDRIMPGQIDGLQLLKRIVADSRLKEMPVIMQTAAKSPEQIAEGIEEGAFYYLTKPYSMKTLLSIVHSVVANIELRREVALQSSKHINALKHFNNATLTFSTVEDVHRIAALLAALCPDPDKVSNGLVELLLNAVEHGNLGITYDEKKEFMYEDCWMEEVKRRQCMPEYKDKFATVELRRLNNYIEFEITDQGKGFDWKNYLKPDPERSLDPNGRGIAMAARYSFSAIQFIGNGNRVMATVATS